MLVRLYEETETVNIHGLTAEWILDYRHKQNSSWFVLRIKTMTNTQTVEKFAKYKKHE
jgi:hypothetical protein